MNRLTPIIQPVDSIFTPPSPVYSGIAGLSISVSSAVTFFLEFNPGGIQKSGGTGVLYVLPQNAAAAGGKSSATGATSK